MLYYVTLYHIMFDYVMLRKHSNHHFKSMAPIRIPAILPFYTLLGGACMWFGIKISGINGDTPLLPKPDEDQYKNMIPLKPNQTSLITTSQSLKAQLGNPKPRSPANAAD